MNYLLALSIGPVGGFVAAGRRSRDLWFGSTLMSEVTRNVALYLSSTRDRPSIELILPRDERIRPVEAQPTVPTKFGGRVSNKILAIVSDVPEVSALQRLSAACHNTAITYLTEKLEALNSCLEQKPDGSIDREALKQQIKCVQEHSDFLEFSAGWTPFSDSESKFGECMARAITIRDSVPKLFSHPSFTRAGRERSHLDNGRDSVCSSTLSAPLDRAELGIHQDEELDAIGLLRRYPEQLWPKPKGSPEAQTLQTLPFRPITRVALDAWIENLQNKQPQALQSLKKQLERYRTEPRHFNLWCSTYSQTDDHFPFECSVLLENGPATLRRYLEQTQQRITRQTPSPTATPDEVIKRGIDALSDLKRTIDRLHRDAGLPIPYYALIEVDGDGIGEQLKNQKKLNEYGKLVCTLNEFADGAAQEVERLKAEAFYVAGDELLAYSPLDRSLEIVQSLSTLFSKTIGNGTTLSAAIVVAHAKDDLRTVRSVARSAMRSAKRKGGGHLCITEIPRGGSERSTTFPIAEIDKFQSLISAISNGVISLRTEQILRQHLELFDARLKVSANEKASWVNLVCNAIKQQRTRRGVDDTTDSEQAMKNILDRIKDWDSVPQVANELRIASRFADIERQRKGAVDG